MSNKGLISFVRGLREKENREKEGLFVVEGEKMLREAIESRLRVDKIIATREALIKLSEEIDFSKTAVYEFGESDFGRLSTQKTPHGIMGIIEKPCWGEVGFEKGGIYLDRVQDPGNVGTILRLADWFGVGVVMMSEGCADAFQAKVVQASMGAIFRVPVKTLDLEAVKELKSLHKTKCYGAYLEGKSLYESKIEANGIVFMGNESQGLSKEVGELIDERITIPRYGNGESLNVAVATAVICGEWRRGLNK